MEASREDLGRLLALAEVESAGLLEQVPAALERIAGDRGAREQIIRFSASVIGRRGPWYGKLMALELLGRLQGVEEAHGVIRCLDDDNHHILEAAGHALERLGPDGVPALQAAYEDGHPDPESLEWIVAAICQSGSDEALSFILYHLDELVVELDAGFVCEWAAVLGAEELIPRFRDLLDADMARVGQALLLVSAIHDRHVPEEERILQAIDHSHHSEHGPDGMEGGPGQGGGPYLM
jgi:HEAT repeat protein